ncbi:transcription termination factor NusA [Patescibacteria group bacterium]|nr:transcription termination factor NusA [Patescibacteria group bacterium]
MQDLKTLISSISQIAEEKGIPAEKIIEVIEMALAAAYKKDKDRRGENIQAKLESESGKVKFWQVLEVVDESMIYSEEELEELKKQTYGKAVSQEIQEDRDSEIGEEGKTGLGEECKMRFNPKKHIMLAEAQEKKPKIKIGEELIVPLKPEQDYGRIAAQTAKQVILQRLKEAERDAIFEEFKEKEEEVVSGIVQRIEGKNVFFDLGKVIGILPPIEQIPTERYNIGERQRLLIKTVETSSKGPVIVLSRAYPKFVTKLFEIEVPEVSSGQVEIKSVAREPGFRTKMAVFSKDNGIDCIGAMVGQRGTRVLAVINSLSGEKIDIIEWSENTEDFISNALSPAKVTAVEVKEKGQALVTVPEDQLSLAIGKGGQNVRLAAKLTGWKIDIKVDGQDKTIKAEDLSIEEQEKVEREEQDKKEKKGKEEDKKDKPKKKVKQVAENKEDDKKKKVSKTKKIVAKKKPKK